MYLLKSAIFFFKLIFFKIEVEYIIIYLNHFNRHQSQNNFLRPFINLLNMQNKSYLLLEDTDLKGAYSSFERSNIAIYFDFITLCYIFLLKLGISKVNSARLLKKIFFRNLSYTYLINMAGYTLDLFCEMFPQKNNYELQHGLVFNNREWWMLDRWNKYDNAGIILHGRGSKNLVIENKDYKTKDESKIIISGFQNNKILFTGDNTSNIIIFTEQITLDNTEKEISEYINYFETLFISLNNFIKDQNIKIFIKAHPRRPNSFIEKYKNFSHVHNLEKFNSNKPVLAHLTFNSSSVFEFASAGIPSIIINGLQRRNPKFLNKIYKMPCDNLVVNQPIEFENAIKFLKHDASYACCCTEFREWSQSFNEPFDDSIFSYFEAGLLN
jgi:hypothetical protein